MGATALQAQPARQPILKDEMAALDRLVSRQVERVERQIDDRPFIAPPASEPAMRIAAAGRRAGGSAVADAAAGAADAGTADDALRRRRCRCRRRKRRSRSRRP